MVHPNWYRRICRCGGNWGAITCPPLRLLWSAHKWESQKSPLRQLLPSNVGDRTLVDAPVNTFGNGEYICRCSATLCSYKKIRERLLTFTVKLAHFYRYGTPQGCEPVPPCERPSGLGWLHAQTVHFPLVTPCRDQPLCTQ